MSTVEHNKIEEREKLKKTAHMYVWLWYPNIAYTNKVYIRKE